MRGGGDGVSKSSRLAVRYFDDRVLLTDNAAWAYFRLPTVSYEFTTGEEREALATNITIALAGIRMQDAEIHLRIAHRTYPAAEWALALDRTSDGGPGWREYLEETYAHVWAQDFWTKEVYLGVRLGPRGMGAQLSGGVLKQPSVKAQRASSASGRRDRREGDRPLDGPGRRIGRALGGSALCPAPPPRRWRGYSLRGVGVAGRPPPSTVPRRTGARARSSRWSRARSNGRSYLKVEQPNFTGAGGGATAASYVAYLSFARFPDMMPFPDGEPWLHYADALPFPVEISSRMKLIPPAKASKDVSRKLAHARDMDQHIREAGAEAPIALAEQIDAARMLEHGITKERLPFVYGWHRLIVSAPTEEICRQRIEAVIEHYRDMGIDVVNSTGDQFSLFCESLPGERVKINAYAQRQPLRRSRAACDRDGRPRRPPGRRRRAGSARTSARRSAGPVHRALRPAGRRGPQPPDRRGDHR